jgi:hypothetical protein
VETGVSDSWCSHSIMLERNWGYLDSTRPLYWVATPWGRVDSSATASRTAIPDFAGAVPSAIGLA